LELEDLLVLASMEPLLEERLHRLPADVAPTDEPLVSLKVWGDVKGAWLRCLAGVSGSGC
jgi:hypothetical protein